MRETTDSSRELDMGIEPTAAAIERYVIGDCSAVEANAVERWMARSPSDATVVRWLCARIQWPIGERPNVHMANVRAEFTRRVAQRMDAVGFAASDPTACERVRHGRSHTLERRFARSWITPMLGVATVAAVLIEGLELQERRRRTEAPPVRYATTNGQRATITLSDGTTVALNVASRLDVPADYMTGNHTVQLSGEAIFMVTHRDRTPLTVLAGSSTARVLGTSFLVRHYTTDSVTTIAVREGKVAVRAANRETGRSTVLVDMQQGIADPRGAVRVAAADPAQFGFASGVLVLNGVTLMDAIPALNRWYDTDVRLGSPALATRRIVGGFRAGSVTDLAAILELMFDVRVVRGGRVLTLYTRE